jgi:hypothetical protein
MLIVEYAAAVSDGMSTALRINAFLGASLNIAKMAAAMDPALHRNRRGMKVI